MLILMNKQALYTPKRPREWFFSLGICFVYKD